MTAPLSQGELGIERMCRLAEVSRAGYYRRWRASAPRREEMGLRDAIQRLALLDRHYGYRRITAELGRQGWRVNHKRVLRMTHEDNLLCLRKRAFVPATTDSRHGWRVVANLARGMELTGLDQLWVADITYVHLAEEFAYLAIVLDAFSRRVIGWSLETHLQASLAIAALDMAIAARAACRGRIEFIRPPWAPMPASVFSETVSALTLQPAPHCRLEAAIVIAELPRKISFLAGDDAVPDDDKRRHEERDGPQAVGGKRNSKADERLRDVEWIP